MKKTLSLLLAVLMMLSILPAGRYGDRRSALLSKFYTACQSHRLAIFIVM